jgi:hypothetical protein
MSFDSQEKFVIFHIAGGVGKHIAATAVLEGINDKYPDRKLIVVCAWTEVFEFHPLVDRVYQLGNTDYFYQDYIEGKDVVILMHDPYHVTGHIKQEQHLIKSWYECLNLDYNNQLPKLYSSYRIREIVLQKFRRNKPIMLIHSNGGMIPNDNEVNPYNIKSWARDMPLSLVQKLVDKYKDTYHIMQVCKHKNNLVQGAEYVQTHSLLELFTLLRLTTKRILIDSSLQHAAAAYQLPSVVLWNTTSPNVYSYDIHKNVLSNKEKLTAKNRTTYFEEYAIDGNPLQCPYEDEDIFDFEEVTELVDKL